MRGGIGDQTRRKPALTGNPRQQYPYRVQQSEPDNVPYLFL